MWTAKQTVEGQVHILNHKGQVVAECTDMQTAQLLIGTPGKLLASLSAIVSGLLVKDLIEENEHSHLKMLVDDAILLIDDTRKQFGLELKS